MKRININGLFPHYQLNKTNIYEKLLIIGFFLGVFLSNSVCNSVRYLILLIVEFLLFLKISRIPNKINGFISVLLLSFFVAVIFLFLKTDVLLIVNRVFPMISVFGIVVVGRARKNVDIEKILKGFLNLYLYLAIIIDFDYLLYITTENAIWEPIQYIRLRAIGPQGDPNFLALYSCMSLMFLLHLDTNRKMKLIGSVVFLMNIVIANSLSSIVLLIIVTFIHGFLPNKNRTKNIIILIIYFVVIYFYGMYSDTFEKIGTTLLSYVYRGNNSFATVKYISLNQRFVHQYRALQIFVSEWWGQGPRQLVEQLGLDTHNSYIGFLFEQGIQGFLLIIITLKNNVRNSFNEYTSLFVMLLALVLNVHMTSIYSLFLLSQYYDDGNQEKRIWGGSYDKNTLHFG